MPPAENLPPEIQGLSGVFEGVWDSPVGSVPFRIIVERVDHLTAILRFGWGTDPSGECVFPREQMTGAQVSRTLG